LPRRRFVRRGPARPPGPREELAEREIQNRGNVLEAFAVRQCDLPEFQARDIRLPECRVAVGHYQLG
jgi:hypothetical protein